MCTPFGLRSKNVPLIARLLASLLVGTTAEQSGDLAPGVLQRSLRRRARPMTAGQIAEGLIEKRPHGRRPVGSIGVLALWSR